jgi:hypothetical protein
MVRTPRCGETRELTPDELDRASGGQAGAPLPLGNAPDPEEAVAIPAFMRNARKAKT